jgi:TRAP-type mannitol/chloroaromatic compound transport system permease small subunit
MGGRGIYCDLGRFFNPVGEIMRKILRFLDHIIGLIADWALVISGILILIMAVLSTYGVGRRYLIHSPEPYSYEMSTVLLVACVVFSLAALQRHKRHLRVDFIANFLPRTLQEVLTDILTPVLGLFFVVVVTWKSWENAFYSMSIGETSQSSWEEPLFPIKFLVPIGMGLLCLVLAVQLTRGIAALARSIKEK